MHLIKMELNNQMKKTIKILIPMIVVVLIGLAFSWIASATPQTNLTALPKIGISIEPGQKPNEIAGSLQIIFLLTILSLAPAILIMMTSFTRIIIVLSFLRNALGTQQMPPNQVLIGFALFLTFFIMAPIGTKINVESLQPYSKGQITQDVAFKKAMSPVRDFMFKQTRSKDIALFQNLAKIQKPKTNDDIPNTVIIPAFIISELKTAFQIGFIIFIPFLIVDMVVSSTLMSMGMMMLPPVMISLPFKILLFIMVDGWNLITSSIVSSFK